MSMIVALHGTVNSKKHNILTYLRRRFLTEISNTVQPLSNFELGTIGVPKFIEGDISGD